MTREEKLLYHQIHPLKLLTDFSTSFASSWLLWEGEWARAAAVALLPSVLVTVLLMGWADLEPYKRARIGRYIAGFMDRKVEGIRFGGQAVAWIGAAAHVPWLLPLGYAIVAFGWLKGLWLPATPATVAP